MEKKYRKMEDKLGKMTKKAFKFIAVRHAESLWNDYADNPENCPEGPVITMNKTNFEPFTITRDPSISPTGHSQALELSKSLSPYFSKQSIKVIFLSPMRRAMQTLSIAIEEMMKNGVILDPKEFKIIVSSLLLPKGTCPPDFPFDHFESRDILPDFLDVDFSEIDELKEKYGDFWFLKNLLNFNKKGGPVKRIEETLEIVDKEELTQQEKFVLFCRKIVDYRPKYFESNPMIKKRFKALKKIIREKYPEYNNGEIMFVTHNGFIKRFFDIDDADNARAMELVKKIKVFGGDSESDSS